MLGILFMLVFLFLLSCLTFSLFNYGHPGWAPHAYFEKVAERNGVQPSFRRAHSLGVQLQETDTEFIRSDKSREIDEPSSEITIPSLAMEAGTRYWF